MQCSCIRCYSNNISLRKVSFANGSEHVWAICHDCNKRTAVSKEYLPSFDSEVAIPLAILSKETKLTKDQRASLKNKKIR